MSSRPATPATAVGGLPRGFTLLEVMLTLLLASLVLVALAMAIDFQLRVVDRGRDNVEEAQLARVLLHRIADDLRGAVPSDPLNMEDLVAEVISSAAGSVEDIEGVVGDIEGAAAPDDKSAAYSEDSKPDDSEAEDTFDVEDTEDFESDETAGTAESSVPRSIPGVYGESDWIQVDVGRLPRLDQFEALFTSTEGSTTVDRLSDVKTVTYYVIPPEDGSASLTADGMESSGGLVRRELDRAVSSWASDQGQLEGTDSDVTPIAPEVSAIAFRYSDGSEWVDSWDSDETGALPVAVEITISIMPIRRESRARSSGQTSTSASIPEEEELLTRSLIVHLQAAEACSGEGTEETYEETEESAETAESSSSETGSADEGSTR